MEGGNYIRGKRGMSIIAEAAEHLQLFAFLKQTEISQYEVVVDLQSLFKDAKQNEQTIRDKWENYYVDFLKFETEFQQFKTRGCEISQTFHYWNRFIEDIAPVLRYLTKSFREADWDLHLSAVHRAIPLCFAFDRINYARWLPIYYEDCLSLPETFPDIHSSFMNGDFIVHHTARRGAQFRWIKPWRRPITSPQRIIQVSSVFLVAKRLWPSGTFNTKK